MATKKASVTAEVLREFLRQAAELGTWNTAYAQKTLGADAKTTREALVALQTSGYIEAAGTKDTWQNTAAGNTAVGVSAAKPLKRSTIEGKLNELLERVDEVNDDPRYLFRVDSVLAFGPYLTKTANIRDVDVAVELEPKEANPEKLQKLMMEHAEKAETAGKKFKNHAARRDWGRTEVLEHLKGRSRAIALREVDDWVLNQPHKALR